MRLREVGFEVLKGKRIIAMEYGSPYMPKLGSYGAMTIDTGEGTFVLWQAHGELNLSRVEADAGTNVGRRPDWANRAEGA